MTHTTHTKKEKKLVERVKCQLRLKDTILDGFGNRR